MSAVAAEFTGIRHIRIDDFGSGSITVDQGTRPDVVEASVEAADEDFLRSVQLRRERDKLRIDFPPAPWRSSEASIALTVPAGLSYAIKAAAAHVQLRAEIGPAKLSNGSGDIAVQTATDLECSTGSSYVVVDRLLGRFGKISSGTGDIQVHEAFCPLTVRSGSGDISVNALLHAALQANSGSGDISVPWTTGSVDLRTASGSLTIGVADQLPAWLDLSTVSGEISIGLESTAEPGPGEPYVSVRARTASGDITIHRA